MTGLSNKTQYYDLAGNLTVAYSVDRGTSYKYSYDHHNRLTGVGKITGGSNPSWTTSAVASFAWDALGRRVKAVNDTLGTTTKYLFDGVNELVETDGADALGNWFVHGLSYIDEHIVLHNAGDSKNYYYAFDRMYNVVGLVDRAGALVERYAYDPYGRPLIREAARRGDMNHDGQLNASDATRAANARDAVIWDPRADMDDDGDVQQDDLDALTAKTANWYPAASPTVACAFSKVGNPFMFQGVPHYSLDTVSNATQDVLSLCHHRNRLEDCPTGRWNTKDPLFANPFVRTPRVFPRRPRSLKQFPPKVTGCSSEHLQLRTPSAARENGLYLYLEKASLYDYLRASGPKESDPHGLVCGSGITDDLVPDSPFGFDFTPCCQAHDDCYGCCGKTKWQCDLAFLECMQGVCESHLNPGQCNFAADAYYGGVSTYGDSAYTNAQATYCGGCICGTLKPFWSFWSYSCCASAGVCNGMPSGTSCGANGQCTPIQVDGNRCCCGCRGC